ncbi:hypothetical protein ACOSP7_019172 [Xanthoceras sorbifolium]|uniref:cyclin-dependent kinase n=1 Tax=Xanthoceras sorbifolium TaxID=99658 RepID=A0ABQ8I2E4_9ROSI|nr:hypothetical protein JRO89_XS05G0179300 [Xanthoceras sorbifolium]
MDNRYKIICRIAKESLGVVQLCLDFETGQTVAMKTIRIIDPNEGVQGSIIKEVSLSKELYHDYIVRLLEVRREGHSVKLIYEHLDSDLHIFMREYPGMSSFLIQRFLYQILHGIAYFHSLELFHRYLKPDCVLVDTKTKFIKIADAGLAKPIGVPHTDQIIMVENQKYRAPEILLGDTKASTPVDMWAVGCMFAEMVTKEPLFPGKCAEDVLREIFCVRGVPNEDNWPGVTSLPNFNATLYNTDGRRNLTDAVPDLQPNGIDLLSKMLCLNPVERITAKAALTHPYFDY